MKRRISENVKEALESIDPFVKAPNLTKLNEDDKNFRFFPLNTDSAMFRDAAWIFDFSVGTLCINWKLKIQIWKFPTLLIIDSTIFEV